MRILVSCVLAALVACGGSRAPASGPSNLSAEGSGSASAQVAKMDTFETNGLTLSGAEYWPYIGEADIKYPEEVLWGFYPQQGVVPPGETDPNPASARPEAIACAEQAYAALQAFVKAPPAKFLRVMELAQREQQVVPRFYLWTNDYGRAATPYPPGVREARLWYWRRKQPDPPKPPGYWKWESSLLQSGECTIPRAEQIDEYLTKMIADMEKQPG